MRGLHYMAPKTPPVQKCFVNHPVRPGENPSEPSDACPHGGHDHVPQPATPSLSYRKPQQQRDRCAPASPCPQPEPRAAWLCSPAKDRWNPDNHRTFLLAFQD